ncbi:MAG: hypothetical protein ACYDEF_08560 [Methanosarcina sp.]
MGIKEGFKKVSCSIPVKQYEIIKKFNENNVRPLDISKVMANAVAAEVGKIEGLERKSRLNLSMYQSMRAKD